MALSTPPEVLLRQAIWRGLHPSKIQGLSYSVCSSRAYKAAVCTKLGEPLEIQERPVPAQLKANEVLVSTHGVGVNFADILSCKGLYQQRVRTPFIPGAECAGKVVSTGSDVKGFKKGDRVFALSFDSQGSSSELLVANEKGLIPVPNNLSLVNAAATIVAYATAMMALTRKARLKKRETVLVTAAAGATGLAASDIAANLFDCRVIAVCGGEEKCKFMNERGVSDTIDYTTQKIRDRVKEITAGKGVDVVMDQVGGDNLLECVKSLGFEGRALTIGYASGKIPSIPSNLLLLKSASLMGVFWGSYAASNPTAFKESITQVLQAVAEGKIKPYCGKTFPLEQINEAYQYILDRKNVGKVVIKMKEEDDPAGI